MSSALRQLLELPGLTTAATLPTRAPATPHPLPLECGQLHEFASADPLPHPRASWHPPLTLLTLLAGQWMQTRRLVCIGRACWPSFQLLCAALAKAGSPLHPRALLARTLFLDPLTDQERFWAIGQALRCPGVAVVLADASKLDLNTSRRLQLAAEAGNHHAQGPLALLARPAQELDTPSWAATRWSVRSQLHLSAHPKNNEPAHRWLLELKTCRGQLAGGRPAQEAPRYWNVDFTYQVFRGTGALHLSAGLGRGTARSHQPLAHAQTA